MGAQRRNVGNHISSCLALPKPVHGAGGESIIPFNTGEWNWCFRRTNKLTLHSFQLVSIPRTAVSGEDLGLNALSACKETTRHAVSKGALNPRPQNKLFQRKSESESPEACSCTTSMATVPFSH